MSYDLDKEMDEYLSDYRTARETAANGIAWMIYRKIKPGHHEPTNNDIHGIEKITEGIEDLLR